MSKTTTQETRATALDRLDPVPAGRAITGRERRAAIQQWLLTSAGSERQAHRQWACGSVAVLRCGQTFDAVRIPVALVEGAAGTDDRQRIAAYLNEALFGGATFIDEVTKHVYCLVEASAGDWDTPDTWYLGKHHHLGVPRLDATRVERTYWLVAPDVPVTLCLLDAVRQMTDFARFRAATRTDG
ncbi:hypothetical protein [Streptomyces sp. CC224B]|uniref:hypothetical protein n=1 Tax=Streptomyces sp. CC224B TaxID=3044571 RepID=UPI0024A86050|nr:hypothetical protein [Streptomyces sp. CC224B]